jgi:hypothetical protein
MNDPYDISEAPPGDSRAGLVRPVLWLLLAISAAGNMVTSSTGVNVAVSVAFGAATLGCATALIVHHYRNRR